MSNTSVSVVIPTHNRIFEVHEKVVNLLDESLVREVIVVIDGSTDGTGERLREILDPRLFVIENGMALGPSRARNIGIRHATCEWVALLDDDDYHSEGFLQELTAAALDSGADVVGTAWLHFEEGTAPRTGFSEAPRGATGPTSLSPSVVPLQEWNECLWLPNNVLARRSLLDEVKFDEGYRGNFWREESDFFISAVRAGYKVVATNRAYSYQFEKPAGGISRSNRLLYEYWVVRNEIRFLMRHGRWLKDRGEIKGIASFLWASVVRRVTPLLARLAGRHRKAGEA